MSLKVSNKNRKKATPVTAPKATHPIVNTKSTFSVNQYVLFGVIVLVCLITII